MCISRVTEQTGRSPKKFFTGLVFKSFHLFHDLMKHLVGLDQGLSLRGDVPIVEAVVVDINLSEKFEENWDSIESII